jgi:hypothetical protein
MIVVGSGALQREDGAAIHAAVAKLAYKARAASGCGEDWRVLNVLHRVSPGSFCSFWLCTGQDIPSHCLPYTKPRVCMQEK